MTAEQAKVLGEVTFRYAECRDHRTIYYSGAIGGPSPDGQLAMSIYTERVALPEQTTELLLNNVTTGEARDKRIPAKAHPLREIQFTTILSVESARRLAAWLTMNADLCEKMKGAK